MADSTKGGFFPKKCFLSLSVVVGLLGGLLLLGLRPAVAQMHHSDDPLHRESPEQQVENPKKTHSSTRLPSWAEPSSPSPSRTSSPSYEKNATTNAPSLPSDPDKVPVDGGLALLAAAGAGYAVRKLQDGDGDGGVE